MGLALGGPGSCPSSEGLEDGPWSDLLPDEVGRAVRGAGPLARPTWGRGLCCGGKWGKGSVELQDEDGRLCGDVMSRQLDGCGTRARGGGTGGGDSVLRGARCWKGVDGALLCMAWTSLTVLPLEEPTGGDPLRPCHPYMVTYPSIPSLGSSPRSLWGPPAGHAFWASLRPIIHGAGGGALTSGLGGPSRLQGGLPLGSLGV